MRDYSKLSKADALMVLREMIAELNAEEQAAVSMSVSLQSGVNDMERRGYSGHTVPAILKDIRAQISKVAGRRIRLAAALSVFERKGAR